MEFIFTLLDEKNSFFSRDFEFAIDSKKYHCRFDHASDRLILLSKLFRPAAGVGDDRNLMLLSFYTNPELAQKVQLEESFLKGRVPVSFFVGEFESFNEESIVETSKHINFFMRYYDRSSTTIMIHSHQSSVSQKGGQLQFIQEDFPKKISTQHQNPYLLDLVLVADETETSSRLKFIYYYQILEHAAFYYVDEGIKRDLLKLIVAPDIHSNPSSYIPQIIDVISESSVDETAKLEKLIRNCCSTDTIWREIQQNMLYFCQKQEFDGGFEIEPCISEDMTFESFSTMWLPKISNCLRFTRNALVHGREKRSGMVIAPTLGNDVKIRPWLPVIRRMAEQVIIFGRTT